MPNRKLEEAAPRAVDVAIIGSGPGGAVVATFLAQRGYRVLMIERDRFPRFHVGESLLPATQEIWERMGIAERLQHSRHTFKYAAKFMVGRRPDSSEVCTVRADFNNFPRRALGPRPYTYQVERGAFDKELRDFAVEQGADLWEQTAVEEVLFDEKRATGLRVRRQGGQTETVTSKFIVDASGRRCFLGRQLDCIEPDAEIKTSAVFGHFRGVRREAGVQQGYFNGYFIENGWIWLIPLANDVMSVGLVQNEPATNQWSNQPEEVLLSAINRYRFVRERFTEAVQVGRARCMTNLAYQTRQFCGDGWLSVGDANFFVDPLYSSGVQIAHMTGEWAAEAIDGFLSGQRNQAALRRYERLVNRYRRNVFGPMRTLYRLMRHYHAIHMYVHSTGKWGRNFHTWFLRRVNCWGSGYFERYNWAINLMQLSGNTVARVVPAVMRLRGAEGWKRYEQAPCQMEPLRIPKELAQSFEPQARGESEQDTEAGQVAGAPDVGGILVQKSHEG